MKSVCLRRTKSVLSGKLPPKVNAYWTMVHTMEKMEVEVMRLLSSHKEREPGRCFFFFFWKVFYDCSGSILLVWGCILTRPFQVQIHRNLIVSNNVSEEKTQEPDN